MNNSVNKSIRGSGIRGDEADIVVVGAGLAGLVAAYEASQAGRKVIIVDQENANNIGGQAFWSLGGIFLIDSPEQRRLGVKDSFELAREDWFNSAQFDRKEDYWPRQWASAYLDFAFTEKRDYLHNLGVRFVPVVGWAERGEGKADGHGNSVPRFHLTWGTGPEIVRVFKEPLDDAVANGLVSYRHRHRVDQILVEDGRAVGVKGAVLAPCDDLPRGEASTREETGETFEIRAKSVLIATGGVGGNLEAVRKCWPTERLGEMPDDMVCGVPAHVDGRGIEIAGDAGANLINRDRMWHYAEGMMNWNPIWPKHGIRIIPGPSALWFDAEGKRLPAPYIPGADTVGTMRHILATGHSYSWFVLNKSIVSKEFIFSGSEQNPDLTDKQIRKLVGKVTAGVPGPIQAFMDHGEDWVVADTLNELVDGMNRISGADENPDVPKIDVADLREQIRVRDLQANNPYSKDYQVNYVQTTRKFLGDKLIRSVAPSPILDPDNGPLIAIRLRMLTRKTLGGIETNLSGQALKPDGTVFEGLYAAGEASGFGGGGVHGNNALEGTFLGGCIFSGRQAGRAMAAHSHE